MKTKSLLTILFLLACSQIAASQTTLKRIEYEAIAEVRPRIIKNVEPAKAALNFDFERQTFELINLKRAEAGLQPLSWSDEAAKTARLHSENMANFKFFSHRGLDGLMVNDRAESLGIKKWRAISENIAYNRGFKKPLDSAVQQWLNSAPHRENMMGERWSESGIGVAIAPDGTYYFTQVFIARR